MRYIERMKRTKVEKPSAAIMSLSRGSSTPRSEEDICGRTGVDAAKWRRKSTLRPVYTQRATNWKIIPPT
jgi:hypothetical protein